MRHWWTRNSNMAARTENSATPMIESSSANLGESTVASSKTVFRNYFHNDRQPEVAICAILAHILPFPVIFCYHSYLIILFRAHRGRKTQIFCWNLNAVCHCFRDMSIFGLRAYIAIFGCRSSWSTSYGNTVFEFTVVEGYIWKKRILSFFFLLQSATDVRESRSSVEGLSMMFSWVK